MIHEDYLVRQIKMMVAFIAKMIFKKDTINDTSLKMKTEIQLKTVNCTLI